MTTKQMVILFAVLVVIGLFIGLSRESKPVVTIPAGTAQTTPISMCYYKNDKTASGLYDRAWVKLNIDGSKVTGEFRSVPAEKDSKVGTFVGTVSSMDPATSSRTATVIWDSFAEGMKNKEELLISFGEGSAAVAFGEMVQGANGTYVYKDKSTVTYQQQMSQIDCATLDEITAVETYLKSADIAAITNQKPTLGGKLYVTAVAVDATTHTALISYEDGHVAGKGTLTYTFAGGKVTVVSFVKAK